MENIDNIQKYIKENLFAGKLNTFEAYSIVKVSARIGIEGETIETFSNGFETKNVVKKINGKLDYVVTRLEDDKIYTDSNSNVNQWVISYHEFHQNYYEIDQNIFQAKKENKTFVQVTEDISFSTSWNHEMVLKKNGYLNITNFNHIYGIQENDFKSMYVIDFSNKDSLFSLLYKFPLYNYYDENKVIKILIYGSGKSSHEFLNITLEMGQVPDHQLVIMMISEEVDVFKMRYLKNNPEISNFFNIDSLNEKKSTYGDILFKKGDIFDVYSMINAFNYVFIEDSNLLDFSKDFSNKMSKNSFLAGFVNNQLYFFKDETFNIHSDTIIEAKMFRYALNTHLTWANNLYSDVSVEKSKFKSDYYLYTSSLSFALSIKYKFWMLGIDFDETNQLENAILFNKNIKSNRKLFNKLVAYEHRRWVVFNITNGWVSIQNYTGDIYKWCIENKSHKNKEKKIHGCIVDSNSEEIIDGKFNRWEGKDALHDLDPLDQFSVKLHRAYQKEAEKYKNTYPLSNPDSTLRKIKMHLPKSSRDEINNLEFVIGNILHGSIGYVKSFYDYTEKILRSVDGKNNFKILETLFEKLNDEMHFPIEACKKTNFKQFDYDLVTSIPFILTHDDEVPLAIAFSELDVTGGGSDRLIELLASSIVIKPLILYFIIFIDSKSNVDLLITMLEKSLNFIQQTNRSHVTLVTACKGNNCNIFAEKIEKVKFTFKNVKTYINQVETELEAISHYNNELSKFSETYFDGSGKLFNSQMYNSRFISLMSQNYKYFEFDYSKKIFMLNENCMELNFINDKSHLKINEKFALSGAKKHNYNYPNIGDKINQIWNIYKQDYKFVLLVTQGFSNNKDKETVLYEDFVRNIKMKYIDRVNEILQKLEVKGFIRLEYDQFNEIYSIKILSKRYFKLLASIGYTLEAFVYYKCVESGFFDDVVTNYQFFQDDYPLESNEIDIVLTKGFNTLIIECKSGLSITQDFYYKLFSLGESLGSSTKKVMLISNGNIKNNIVIKGNRMGIKTINKVNDDIAHTLNKLF